MKVEGRKAGEGEQEEIKEGGRGKRERGMEE